MLGNCGNVNNEQKTFPLVMIALIGGAASPLRSPYNLDCACVCVCVVLVFWWGLQYVLVKVCVCKVHCVKSFVKENDCKKNCNVSVYKYMSMYA